jgi:hypothetical protein
MQVRGESLRHSERAAVRELVGAVAQVGTEDGEGDAVAVGDDGVVGQRAFFEDRPVDRLDKLCTGAAQHQHRVDRGQVEFVVAGLDLRLDARVGHRRHGLDLNAGRCREWLEIRSVLRRRVAASPGVDVKRARLRDRPLGDEQRAQGRRGPGRAQKFPSPAVETPPCHGQPPFASDRAPILAPGEDVRICRRPGEPQHGAGLQRIGSGTDQPRA